MPAKISLLLLCVVLALSPCHSAFADPADAALDEAQDLLGWAYDLNAATLSLFRRDVTAAQAGGWRVTYTGDMPYPEPLGTYTVTLSPDAPGDVAWSHDEAYLPAFAGEGVDAPLWGQTQLELAYDAIVHPSQPGIAPLAWLQKDPQAASASSASPVPAPATLPEGSLRGQTDAVAAFLSSGAFDTQSAAEKADVVQRIFEAGLESLLPADVEVYDAPGPADLPLEEALTQARQALTDTYGFTNSCFSLFEVQDALTVQPDGRYWALDFLPDARAFAPLSALLPAVGCYRVRLDASYGELRYVTWSLDGQLSDTVYTRQTWGILYHRALRGQREALPAWMLSWLAELLEGLSAIRSRYPADTPPAQYSLPDAAAHDSLLRAAGFPRSLFPHGQPGPEDMSQGDAVLRTRQLLRSKLDLAPELVCDAIFRAEYTVASFAGPRWEVLCLLDDGDMTASYVVYLDPTTGTVQNTQCLTGGSG